MRTVFIFLIILCSAPSQSQILFPGPLDFFSQLNCYSKTFAAPFSLEGNPAGISFIEKPMISVACKNKFLVNNLNQYGIACVIPTTHGAFGLQMQSLQFGDFAEMKPAIAYSKKLGQVFLGLQFHYHSVRIAGYGSIASLIPEMGTVWKLKENVFVGLRIYRPIVIRKNVAAETFGYNYSTGIGYQVSHQVLLAASVQVQENLSSQLNLGIQYQFSQQLFASLGSNCRNGEWHFQAGWKWNSLLIEALMSYHTRLGLSSGLLLQYDLKRGNTNSASN